MNSSNKMQKLINSRRRHTEFYLVCSDCGGLGELVMASAPDLNPEEIIR